MDNKKYQKVESGYISASPLPNKEELEKFYRDLYYQSPQSATYQIDYPKIEIEHKRLKNEVLMYALKNSGIESGKFLDIGAGEGFLLQTAYDYKFSVTGIDFSSFGVNKFHPELSKFLRVGDVYENIEDLIKSKEKFNIISSINVLEHVIDPELFLSKVDQLLENDGLVSITVPNDFSDLQNLAVKEGLIDREFWFSPPAHLHYFNTKTLPDFCIQQGYEVVDSYSDFPIDIFLFHSGSNYVMDSKNGPSAHKARMLLDLLVSNSGLDRYLKFYRSMFEVGLGRDITVILKKSK
ncbi:class I SAM-dependent methyltransferase [Leptospira sp. GIMC2001]|uniref:class I SAM-dependent methyltransferase n=1 Tax=Leptospira sp. GIMC2001 TaxID=1513297 RepID=UPI00234AA4D9|nr:class I SAM-dependent methyltransferase [Leptospira sp. GIMC2001]WCL51224.1 class I SAM-dependent methyltransferase [Leptospira sp. GIMC2001]